MRSETYRANISAEYNSLIKTLCVSCWTADAKFRQKFTYKIKKGNISVVVCRTEVTVKYVLIRCGIMNVLNWHTITFIVCMVIGLGMFWAEKRLSSFQQMRWIFGALLCSTNLYVWNAWWVSEITWSQVKWRSTYSRMRKVAHRLWFPSSAFKVSFYFLLCNFVCTFRTWGYVKRSRGPR